MIPPRRLLLVALATLLAVLGLVPPAQAADAISASVELTAVTPEVGAPGGTVTLSGTVTNTGTKPLYTVQVMTCRDSTPITTRKGLTDALAVDPLTAPCTRLTTEASYVTVTAQGAAFAPGSRSPFTLTATMEDLGFRTAGAYVVGIHVRASADRSTSFQTVGRARTLLPVVDPARQRPAQVTSVVLLTSRPALVRPGVLADDHLAAELTGRLLTLVRSAQREGVSYAIDPALYREVSVMAQGYTLPDGSSGAGQQAARQWLTEVAALRPADGYRLPYGNPDLALAATAGDASIPQRSANALADVPELAGLPLLVRAPNGKADQRFLDFVAGMKPQVVLAATDDPALGLQSAAGLLVSTQAEPFAGGPGPDERGTTLQRVQRLRTESLLAALGPRAGLVRVVDDEAGAGLDATPTAAWEARRPLGAITATGQWTASTSTGAAAGPLSATVIEPLARAATGYATYGDLVGTAVVGDQLAARALAGVPSASWSTDAQALGFLSQSAAEVSDITNGVQLKVSRQVTMTSQENQFPVTVINTLASPVRVRVRFESSNPGRLQVPESELVTVRPHESITVNVNPQAKVPGEVDVVARLVTQGGNPVGTPQKFMIDATEAGRVGWIIVIASGIVLVVVTVWRVRQVARSRGESA